MAFDVKDAFVTVPQRDELYVNLDGLAYRVHRCLPGQWMASAMWGEQFSEDLKSTSLIADAACPAAFGCPGMRATVHVDAVKHVLQQKYRLEVSNYMRNVGDSVKFLKKELIMVEEGIQLKLNPRYLEKICESLKLSGTRPRKTPCGPEISQPDETELLDEVAASRYGAAIGSFLYLSPDRPDCQWTIGHLARSMSKPTKKMYKHACHLAEYLQCTKDVNLTMKWSYLPVENIGEPDLLESFSDSDWAGHWDRISSTCGHLYFNGNVTFCFVRKQGCISLSSCEAELVACCSAAAEALYVRHVVETLTSHSCRIACGLGSSSARSLLLKKGVSKVRHLDTKLLWVQRAHSQGQLELSAVGTHLNTSDIGTKHLTSERYRFLLDRMGYSTNVMPGFHNVTQVRKVEAEVVKYLMVLEALRSLPPTSAQSLNHDEPNVEMMKLEIVFQSSSALSIKGADLIGVFISVVIIVGLALRFLCSCSRWWSRVRHRREHHQPGDSHRGHHRPGDLHRQHQNAEDLHHQHQSAEDLHRQHQSAEDLHRQHQSAGDLPAEDRHAEDGHQQHHRAEELRRHCRHSGVDIINITTQEIHINSVAMQKIYINNVAMQKIYIKDIAMPKIYIRNAAMQKIHIVSIIRQKMYTKILKVNIIINLAMHLAICSLTGMSQDQAQESDDHRFQMYTAHHYQKELRGHSQGFSLHQGLEKATTSQIAETCCLRVLQECAPLRTISIILLLPSLQSTGA